MGLNPDRSRIPEEQTSDIHNKHGGKDKWAYRCVFIMQMCHVGILLVRDGVRKQVTQMIFFFFWGGNNRAPKR